MKIYILDAYHPAGVEYAAKHFEVVRWDDPRVKNWHDDADGVMVRMTPIRAADLARAKKVKVICKQGVGFDRHDLDAWVDDYKRRNGRPARKGDTTWDANEYPASSCGPASGTSTRSCSGGEFARALRQLGSMKQNGPSRE